MQKFPFIDYHHEHNSSNQMIADAENHFKFMQKRRSVRDFSEKEISNILIENLISTASTAPSGAHKQPWTFCVVRNPDIKTKIRMAAEKEEKESYEGRMTDEWIEALKPLGTNWQKPFLEIAPVLIVVFKKAYDLVDGKKIKNYYVNESVGLACGFLIQAIHNAGLCTLTHTPSPMNFLQKILQRPENERPFLLLPIGFPASNAKVPDLKRKPLTEILFTYD